MTKTNPQAEFEQTVPRTVNDANQEVLNHVETSLREAAESSFIKGQLDCREHGDPSNHKHFDAATAQAIVRALEELRQTFLDAEFNPTGGEVGRIDSAIAKYRKEVNINPVVGRDEVAKFRNDADGQGDDSALYYDDEAK